MLMMKIEELTEEQKRELALCYRYEDDGQIKDQIKAAYPQAPKIFRDAINRFFDVSLDKIALSSIPY